MNIHELHLWFMIMLLSKLTEPLSDTTLVNAIASIYVYTEYIHIKPITFTGVPPVDSI